MVRILIVFLLLPFVGLTQATKDTLHVAVYDSPPFGMQSKTGQADGLMVELWEDIAEDLQVTSVYHFTNMNGVLSGLQNKTYDIGLGAISITPQREKLVDFTQAVNPSGTGIAVSKELSKVSFLKKWMPILTSLFKLIGVLLLMLFISALIVWLIERKYGDGLKSDRGINNIADGLWWSAVTMTTVGYGDKVPSSKAGKILGIVWIFISIIFFSLFTAHASSQLSNWEASSNVNTVDDLRGINVVAVAKSSGEEYLLRENIPYKPKNNIDDAIHAVLDGEADAIVSNVPVLKYHNRSDFNEKLRISTNYLVRNNMGMALQDQSPWREQIDILLLQKITEPKWQDAVYRYIGE
ncbi:MAG: transporter substrate-binding domain-containing protein [Bacteroidota bacterium]